jgi:hypothetical protein
VAMVQLTTPLTILQSQAATFTAGVLLAAN